MATLKLKIDKALGSFPLRGHREAGDVASPDGVYGAQYI